jgi:hypothetical protein
MTTSPNARVRTEDVRRRGERGAMVAVTDDEDRFDGVDARPKGTLCGEGEG